MKKSRIVISLALTLMTGMFSACGSANAIKNPSPANGTMDIEIANTDISDFLSKKWTSDLCDTYYEDGWCHYEPCYVDFTWTGNADTFSLSKNADMSECTTYACEGENFSLRGLNAHTTYYWQVANGEQKSDVFSFTTANTVRTLYIGGVTNSRDMGGWTV